MREKGKAAAVGGGESGDGGGNFPYNLSLSLYVLLALQSYKKSRWVFFLFT